MKTPRLSGILLHPTSLPGRFGVGDMGPEAYKFVDFLAETGQSLWQVLPLGPTGYGDSPYQCFSAFAGNPLLVSLEALVPDGLLDAQALDAAPTFPAGRVDYGPVIEYKYSMLARAFDRFTAGGFEELKREFAAFRKASEVWLRDYALFRSIKDANGGREWTAWDANLRRREEGAIYFWRENHARAIECHEFFQFLFFKQWLQLAHYANLLGIKIIGDIPIFVAHDSSDVWAHPELFDLDAEGRPVEVAGVPPDYFSTTGQLWGNPLYRWDVMAETGYAWWIDRIKYALEMVDIIRLDHFRGFEKYYAVPAAHTTAKDGVWRPGPGADFFDAIRDALGELPIIAEDLGYITPEVDELRERFGFPGMRILQFAFGTDPQSDAFKPYNYPQNAVVYTGTHDNDTTAGWFTSVGAGDSTRTATEVDDERILALKYMGVDGREVHWDFIRLALASVARTAIIPLADVLGLGSEARMNVPARESGNWTWRYRAGDLTTEVRARLAEMTALYGRDPRRFAAAKGEEVREMTEQTE